MSNPFFPESSDKSLLQMLVKSMTISNFSYSTVGMSMAKMSSVSFMFSVESLRKISLSTVVPLIKHINFLMSEFYNLNLTLKMNLHPDKSDTPSVT